MTERLTIRLTDRAPVCVRKDLWPLIASAKDWDNQYECQANRTWHLRVRQHADGRTLVYAVYDTAFQHERSLAAGELLAAGEDVAAAVRRVGEEIGAHAAVIAECIGDLPAEDLDGDAPAAGNDLVGPRPALS